MVQAQQRPLLVSDPPPLLSQDVPPPQKKRNVPIDVSPLLTSHPPHMDTIPLSQIFFGHFGKMKSFLAILAKWRNEFLGMRRNSLVRHEYHLVSCVNWSQVLLHP